MPDPQKSSLPCSPAFLSVLVGLFAVALYLPSIGFGFVYDSHVIVQVDSFIHQPRHFADILTLRVLGMDVMDFNRPWNLFSLMLDSLLWGKDAPGYHLTNMLLHGTAAALLFRWLFALTGQRWPALLAALLFAAHPLHCEAVSEVCNRKDLLATLFMLAGLLCAIRFKPEGRSWLPAAGTVVFLFLSVASKESGIAGPAILTAYWFLFRRNEKRGPWMLLLTLAGTAVGAFLVARFALEPKHSIIFTDKPGPLAPTWTDAVRVQFRLWAAEFLRIAWPSPGSLCADYNGYSIRNIGFWPALTGVATLFVAPILIFALPRRPVSRRKRKQKLISVEFAHRQRRLITLAFAVFWFSLLPVSNLIRIYHPMADRFLYMPLTGVALALTVFLTAAGRAGVEPKALALTVGVAALGTLVILTWNEEQIWHDPLSLWRATAERNPSSCNALMGLGSALIQHYQPADAVEPLQQAVALSGAKFAEPLAGLALAADALGRQDDAAKILARAAELDPRYNHPDLLIPAMAADFWEVGRYSIIEARSRQKVRGGQ